MKIIGLTGSIGMGKSTVAKQLIRRGAILVDADAIVHHLLQPRAKGFASVAHAFPECVEKGIINRQRLGKIVFGNPQKLHCLENILHPLVRQEIRKIIRRAIMQRRQRVILEIPLLYEIGAEKLCDEVVVVTAPPFIQRQRVMSRPGMTDKKFHQILSFQMPDAQKRSLADTVIHTGLGRAHSFRQAQSV